jgi:protein-S-isoprenylcysteine O-methyltransferase Ste14
MMGLTVKPVKTIFLGERNMNTITANHTVENDSPGVNVMPPTVFLICLILGGILELLFPRDFPLLAWPIRVALGLVLGGAGFAFMIIAHENFKRIGVNVPTNQPASSLVTSGAYRFSRNPMYLGGSALFMGTGLMVGSLWLLATCLPLAFYLTFYVIPREETYMERVFGDEYRAYRRRVGRWL